MTKAYILGALHDGTIRKLTYRIVQKDQAYIEFLAKGIQSLGRNAWIYKEGKTRQLYVVEFSRSFLKDYSINNLDEKIDYIRGYFDAEGGISRVSSVRYYIYFAQKNLKDLEQVRQFLTEFNIQCGKMHNPSRKADPDYWRFFIRKQSYEKFAQIIGSWHPIKSQFLRMKI
ncbi:MAG TPA: LAGLIDADG family homing endonuclease [Patescibacteria group bacterium]|nr:LAGLIDADG family homing endonuclease [Patescibacteria group bacterium]